MYGRVRVVVGHNRWFDGTASYQLTHDRLCNTATHGRVANRFQPRHSVPQSSQCMLDNSALEACLRWCTIYKSTFTLLGACTEVRVKRRLALFDCINNVYLQKHNCVKSKILTCPYLHICNGDVNAHPGPSSLYQFNITAHQSTASVRITVLLYNGLLLCCFNIFI